MATLNTRIPLIYGAATIGAPGTFCKVTDAATAQSIIDEFTKYGPKAIDTSQLYGFGTSEAILASLDLHGSRIDTKIYPLAPGDHKPQRLKELFAQSLRTLKGNKIRVFYLHAPDHTVPFEETLPAINELYLAGHFDYFGLSNYKSFEVAEIVMLCRANGWVVPTVYEGIYNPIDRTAETELIPCLRKFGIRFAAYCPLAGGFLVGHLLQDGALDQVEAGSHFDKALPFGTFFHERYAGMLGPVRELRDVVERHALNLNQASVRWLQHHSAMIPSDLGIIFGGSKPSHVDKTLEYNAEGPLPDEVVTAYEECYKKVRGQLPNYHHDPAWYDPKSHGYREPPKFESGL